ncbi:MAG: alpha/beta fold hydrolase [Acidimicrobiales bacterium]
MKRLITLLPLITILLIISSCSSKYQSPDSDSFYRSPFPTPNGAPGTLIRSESISPPNPKSEAWRVMYTSRGEVNQPIVVTGLVIVPVAPAPTGGRPVVAWAHPTTGIEDHCAPSLQQNPYGSIMGIEEFLAKGWAVVATDYEGLGVAGPHPYLVGTSEARSVLDSVRALRAFPNANVSGQFAVFGHSQGGQAALFTGELATTYAPDLQLVAVAAAAPSGLINEQIRQTWMTEASSYINSYLVTSWQQIFLYDPATVTSSGSQTSIQQIAAQCVLGGSAAADARLKQIFDTNPKVTNPLVNQRITAEEPWRRALETNSPIGKIGAPVLLLQGTADSVIPPAISEELASIYKKNGTSISLKLLEGVPHTLAGYDSVPFVVPFFSSAFR